ncbi:MAG: 1-deoxy-D-xylulose-5-phosphate synthase N-terminal domain-containing protein [Rhodospirillales bacterium]
MTALRALEKKVLWLSTWMIHHANFVRPNLDGMKIGGHQASSASVATLMTALYFDVLRPADRLAVKPHASPVFHAIQYLLGRQTRDKLERFRALGGVQSYPSRTKDTDDVDFSTGSIGLGVAMALFASLAQDYVRAKRLSGGVPPGRMIALVGDAELDEGNVHEALLEAWKHDVRNVWWVIDYNRQSLDAVICDRLLDKIEAMFRNIGWRVVTLKYGRELEAVFQRPGGQALRAWMDGCPNALYSALVFKGAAAWRERLAHDVAGVAGVETLLAERDDRSLAQLMTNLAGHDLPTVLDAFHGLTDDRPTCLIAYTIKGYGLPIAGHKDNHPGLMTEEQMERFRAENGILPGAEWDRFAGLDIPTADLERFLATVPFAASQSRRLRAARVPVPTALPVPEGERMSTQEGFGRLLVELSRAGGPVAERVVTTSPDVTITTNLGGWVNQRDVFHRERREDVFKAEHVISAQRWAMSPQGQHVELGIAENNLFIFLAALGLAHDLFGARLLPIGVLYDPFIQRGLDALNYACYQDARFILVATPSGITLAPEGGAHQSIGTPLIGMAQDGLAAFEPAFVDELAVILAWAFDYLQRDGEAKDSSWLREAHGGSVYLRLSTRAVEQPAREMTDDLRKAIIAGGYWLKPPGPGAELAIVYQGVVASQALAVYDQILEDIPDAGLLAVTSADRLNAGWHAAQRARQTGSTIHRAAVERLLAPLAADASLVTVIDGHPATLAWLGGVYGHRVQALGVEHFGQSGDLTDLHRVYRIDEEAILDATASACLARCRRRLGIETAG